jgi:hypothetical protein
MKNIAFLLVSLLLFSCSTIYGNEKITETSLLKKIRDDASIADVKSLLGAPSRISKTNNSTNEKIYEYEFHKLTLSALYYTPIVSYMYFAFGQNPFSMARTVKANINHNYLFLQFDKNDRLVKKDFYKVSNVARPFQAICSAQGYSTNCVSQLQVNFSY